jgi:hypothetical protein
MMRSSCFEVAMRSWTLVFEGSFGFAFAGRFLGEMRSCSWSGQLKSAVGPADRIEEAEVFVGILPHGWEWTGCSSVVHKLDEESSLDSPRQMSAPPRMSVDRAEKAFEPVGPAGENMKTDFG